MGETATPYDANEPDAQPTSQNDIMLIKPRSGEMGDPESFAKLRVAEALLRIKREHPEAWRILWAAGIRLYAENIDRLVGLRDHPLEGVDP